MRSVTIEFLRFGGDEGILRKRDRYLATCGSNPVREFDMPLSHKEFFTHLKKLRYQASESDRKKALTELSSFVTDILDPPETVPGELLQLDLVTSAAELWALPFEAALADGEKPLFADPDRVVVPTRRIRQAFADRASRWPAKPRVLFAYASPKANQEVPSKAHKDALKAALEPWIETIEGVPEDFLTEGSVLRILPGASLESIAEACRTAHEKKRPFTHVHILAHGQRVKGEWDDDSYFGLALQSKSGKAATAEELVDALMFDKGRPAVVTLAVCDGGNAENSVIPGRSLAHTFHRAGVPVVVGSQLPLTFEGSVAMTREIYGALLSGDDVRLALYKARKALHELPEAKAGHDWVSLVAYVQLPEGYADHLLDVRLQAELACLLTARRWADHILERQEPSDEPLAKVATSLRRRIEALSKFITETEKQTSRRGLYEENAGLLGSAHKRLAELLFLRGSRSGDPGLLGESRAELGAACSSYLQGYKRNLSHHWTGVQYLSLRAILDGSLREKDTGYWHAALGAAEIDRDADEMEYWALGSLAELLLLAPLAGQKARLDEACERLREMRERVKKHSSDDLPIDPIESTRFQLRRYRDWWTKLNGFFGSREKDLSEDAARLLATLES
jgi:CHAT domain-containing protein